VIVFSCTKYIGGMAPIAGMLVGGDNFDWEDAGPERQPDLNTPDPSYQEPVGVDVVKPLGPVAYII